MIVNEFEIFFDSDVLLDGDMNRSSVVLRTKKYLDNFLSEENLLKKLKKEIPAKNINRAA